MIPALAADGNRLAAITPNDPDSPEGLYVARPLSDADAERYRKIFALQENGRWTQADREIKRVQNWILMGHVKAQRYLHPRSYRSRYHELAKWLDSYADHPQANQIYKLALRRKPRNARSPKRPVTPRSIFALGPRSGTVKRLRSAGVKITKRTRRFHSRIRSLVRRKQLTLAEREVRQTRLPAAHLDLAYTRIAAGWFYHGDDDKALKIAARAANRSGHVTPFAFWYAGLAAFRSGKATEAASFFEAMAGQSNFSESDEAAAAFWAGRANMVARRPERVSLYLRIAAKFPRTFYGMVAARLLGIDPPFVWQAQASVNATTHTAMSDARAQRAFALMQAGQQHVAEREFRSLAVNSGREGRLGMLLVADSLGMPGLAYRTAASLNEPDNSVVMRGLYPVPPWKPDGGYTLDRALIFAFMRQESAFNTRAKSRAGARGLMQLMPGTAGYIGNRSYRGKARAKLYDPGLNMALGQKYLTYLLSHEIVDNNLFLLAAAYNGGPGNLAKWRRRIGPDADPLMLIESLPSRETRNFIEHILANLWVYRHRFSQPTPSLDAIAAGRLPTYQSFDKEQLARTE